MAFSVIDTGSLRRLTTLKHHGRPNLGRIRLLPTNATTRARAVRS